MGKGLDIFVADLDIGKPCVLGGQLFEGLLSPVYFRLPAFLDFLQELLHRLFKHLLAHFCPVDDQGHGFAGYFLLHLTPPSLTVPVHIMLYQGGIILLMVDGALYRAASRYLLMLWT